MAFPQHCYSCSVGDADPVGVVARAIGPCVAVRPMLTKSLSLPPFVDPQDPPVSPAQVRLLTQRHACPALPIWAVAELYPQITELQIGPASPSRQTSQSEPMSSLLASDKAYVPCRVEGRADDAERGAGREVGGRVRQRRRERRASARG